MNRLLRFFASATLKTGISYAIKATRNIALAIEAILNGGNLTDEARKMLSAIYATVGAVHDFLKVVGGLIGAPMETLGTANVDGQLADAADKLRRIASTL